MTETQKIYASVKENLPRGASRKVTVNDAPLRDIESIKFTWGNTGRRTYNLAHSIMADYFEDPNVPRELWIEFYEEVMSVFPSSEEWEITSDMISQWIYRRFQDDDESRKDEPEKQENTSSRPLYNQETYHPVPITEQTKRMSDTQPVEVQERTPVIIEDEDIDEDIEDDEDVIFDE